MQWLLVAGDPVRKTENQGRTGSKSGGRIRGERHRQAGHSDGAGWERLGETKQRTVVLVKLQSSIRAEYWLGKTNW